MESPKSLLGREMRAIQLAIACSVIGVTTKFTVGFLTGSMSMISSAIDSLGDLFVSIVNLFVVRLSAKAPDEDHNYGHAKVEGLAAMFEGGFIFAAGGFIIYEAIKKAFAGGIGHDTTLGIIVMIPILALTVGTVFFMRKVAKETGSLVIRSDATHYMMDVYVNVGVFIALVLVKLTGKPIIDSIISIGIALYMFRSSYHIVQEGVDIVMDRSLDMDTVAHLKTQVGACPEIDSFHDFKTRVGRTPQVDFHIVVRPDMTAAEIHDVYLDLQRRVREVTGSSTKVIVHTDPARREITARSR